MTFLDDDKRWREWTAEFDEGLAELMGTKRVRHSLVRLRPPLQ
jgi:hypothetical protein